MLSPILKASVLVAAALAATTCLKATAQPQGQTPSADVSLARYMAKSGPAAEEAFKVTDGIQLDAASKKRLTGAQVATLGTYVDSPYMLVRMEVMVALRNAGPDQAQAASAIARRGLVSNDSVTRLYAQTTLERLAAAR